MNVSVNLSYKDYEPYTLMIESGEVTESEMIHMADHINHTIKTLACSSATFRQAYAQIVRVQVGYADWGFADSEGNAAVREECRRIWGAEAKVWIG